MTTADAASGERRSAIPGLLSTGGAGGAIGEEGGLRPPPPLAPSPPPPPGWEGSSADGYRRPLNPYINIAATTGNMGPRMTTTTTTTGPGIGYQQGGGFPIVIERPETLATPSPMSPSSSIDT